MSVMVADERIRLLFPRILSVVVIGAAIGGGYGYETSIAAAAGLHGLTRGALNGAAASSPSVFVLQAPGTQLARASFMVTVAVRPLVYLVVFLAAIAVGQLLVPNHPPARPVSISRHDVLFCFGATFAVSFLFEVNSLLGQQIKLHPSQITCFRVPDGATLGPVRKYPQFHNLGIEALWFETAVLALPPEKALPQRG